MKRLTAAVRRAIVRDFMAGADMEPVARKYRAWKIAAHGVGNRSVEQVIRFALAGPPKRRRKRHHAE